MLRAKHGWLVQWVAQVIDDSGHCTTIADALAHLRSCPQGNDPLKFIFGDLLARFTPEISGVDDPITRSAFTALQLHFFTGRGHDLASAVAWAYCLTCSSSLRFMSS